MKPVVKEYLSNPTIKQKLSFDPAGRPGASDVRADQDRLQKKIVDYVRNSKLAPMTQFGYKTLIFIRKPRAFFLSSVFPSLENKCIESACGYNNANAKKRYIKEQHDSRRFVYDKRQRYLMAEKNDIAQGSPRKLFGLNVDSRVLNSINELDPDFPQMPAPLGRGWWMALKQDEERDNNHYSKAWHRAYGPKVTVCNRRVVFKRVLSNGRIEEKVVAVDAWRGNYLFNAILEAGLAPKRKNMPSIKIRLHKAFDAKLIADKRNYKIYERTLAGTRYDYVIQSPLGMIYHDFDRDNLVRGLHKKVRGQSLKLSGKLIDWAKCKALGFCSTGIEDFCDSYGLNSKSAYSADEIYSAVKKNPKPSYPYLAELKTLAKAVSYHVPELNSI